METGIELIAEERSRQIEQEGWTPAHDDRCYSNNNELSLAAVCYAIPDNLRYDPRGSMCPTWGNGEYIWPWDQSWFKPSPDDRIRELQKAGALIAAEIDKLQRQTH